MRIAFIGQKGIPVSQGGIERHVENLAIRLAKKGHDVLVYSRSTYQKGDGQLPSKVQVVNLPSLPLKAWDTIVHVAFSMVDVIFRKVDVIHVHHMGPAFFLFIPKIFRPSVRLVFTHHCNGAELPYWGKMARLSLRLGEYVGMHLADEVIAISPVMAEDLEKRYHRKVRVVPNGVNEFIEGDQAFKTKLPEKYILAVSRLIAAKGLDHLINAFQLISADYPDYQLLIVGGATKSDNSEVELKAKAAGNSRIRFLGQKSGAILKTIYENASLFVQPSEIEGLPMVLLEAASFGLPILASDIPEHTTIVNDLAVTFKNKNPIDLAARLRQMLDDLDSYKNNASELAVYVKNNYNWNSVADRVEALYKTAPAFVPGTVQHI